VSSIHPLSFGSFVFSNYTTTKTRILTPLLSLAWEDESVKGLPTGHCEEQSNEATDKIDNKFRVLETVRLLRSARNVSFLTFYETITKSGRNEFPRRFEGLEPVPLKKAVRLDAFGKARVSEDF
jgi:hypothetical protein